MRRGKRTELEKGNRASGGNKPGIMTPKVNRGKKGGVRIHHRKEKTQDLKEEDMTKQNSKKPMRGRKMEKKPTKRECKLGQRGKRQIKGADS